MGKIERFNRTLKIRLERMNQSLTDKLLTSAINNYNNTWHSVIKSTPNQAKGEVMESDLEHNRQLAEQLQSDISIGDLLIGASVLYRLKKAQFDKESVGWSKAVYKIIGYRIQIRSKNRHTLYKSPNDIKLVNDKPTEANIENNQVFEVEKILDHKKMKSGKTKYNIKWKGFDDTTWESQDNLRLIKKNEMSQLEKDYLNI